MKNWFHIYSLILAFFFSPLELRANEDIHTKVCNDTKYLNCMGTNSKDCIEAYTKAKKFCTAKHPYDSASSKKELRATATKNGRCTTIKYISNLGADINKFEKCAVYLEPIFDEFYKNALKSRKESDKRFFEEDDHLHNY